ncbi:MAG TPA: DinB family protein [Dehalococcoidia bacterium]|nr:DinB family protein [Dehalococcoidia bacterium]
MNPDEIAALLAGLRETPQRLAALAGAQREEAWRRPRLAGGWSAAETLAHVRAADAIIAPRLMYIAVREEPFLAAFDDRDWMEVADYVRLPVAALVRGFVARREELLHALAWLPEQAWSRTGIHEARGPQTLHEIAAGIVAHEHEHLDQIETALAGPA